MNMLVNGGIYIIRDQEGLALAGDNFGFHEAEKVVMQPYSQDLNQAWQLKQNEEGKWGLMNLAARQWFYSFTFDQLAYAPCFLVPGEKGPAYPVLPCEEGYKIEILGQYVQSMGAHQPVIRSAEGTIFTFELLHEGPCDLPHMLVLRGDTANTGVSELFKDGDWYYCICDRRNAHENRERVGIKRSKDLIQWHDYDFLLPRSNPRPYPWMEEHVPECDIWCPSLDYFGGKYRIYYAVTKIFKNTTVMGQLSNVTLDKNDPYYNWVDEGPVMITREGDDWNAIDPHVIHTYDGEIWMVYGSAWSGIKVRRINEETGKVYDDKVYSVCYREEFPHPAEGGYLFKRDGWYYLVAAVERMDQNYRAVVGRSRDIRGPYLDRDGVDMMKEGGTTIVEHKRGLCYPGHSTVLQDGDQYYIVFEHKGGRCAQVELDISTLTWEDGWPESAAGRRVLARFEK